MRRLREIYFVDPVDQDYEETLKHATRKLERPLAVAISCKRKARTGNTKVVEEEIAPQNVKKKNYGCTVESHESTRPRVESSLPAKHEETRSARRCETRHVERATRKLVQAASEAEAGAHLTEKRNLHECVLKQ